MRDIFVYFCLVILRRRIPLFLLFFPLKGIPSEDDKTRKQIIPIRRWQNWILCIGIFVLAGCTSQVDFSEKIPEKPWSGVQVAIIPHHMLTRSKVDEFYQLLQREYPHPDRIMILSPNHFNYGSTTLESIESSQNICFRGACVPGIPYPGYQLVISPFPLFMNGVTGEHGIGEHFGFINTYFPNVGVVPVVLRRKLIPWKGEQDIADTISWFSGKTLVLASVDFSHHVDESIARFHDTLAVDVLSNGGLADFSKLEVDCRNCLAVAKLIANKSGKPYFSFYTRTSVDSILHMRSDIENTSHIFGTFTNSGSHTMTGVFAFVWDTQIARGIEEFDAKKPLFLSNVLKDFYERKDIAFPLKEKYNRIGIGFDYFVANLEATFDTDQCDTKWQGIILRMKKENLQKIMDIWINMFNIANNHSDDCGEASFASMQDWMWSQHVPAFGDAKNGTEYTWTGLIRGEKFAMVGVNVIETSVDWKQKIQNIEDLTASGYLVIANFHWGKEYSSDVTDTQRRVAHEAIDAGARLVIWHHPHVIEPKELYRNIPIYYSLGNFLFDQDFPETLSGIMALCEISRANTSCADIPFTREAKIFTIKMD